MSYKKSRKKVDVNEMRRELVEYIITKNREHVAAEDRILAEKPNDPVRQNRHSLATKMLSRELNAELKDIYDLKKRKLEALYWDMEPKLHPANTKASKNTTPKLDPEVVDCIGSLLKD